MEDGYAPAGSGAAGVVALPRLLVAPRDPQSLVALTGGVPVRWSAFLDLSRRFRALVESRREARWLLAVDDAWRFSAALFAILAAGRTAVVPPNFLPATRLALSGEFDATIDEAAAARASATPARSTPPVAEIDADARIDLYTSGTTGTPKRIAKRLAQLDAEVGVLEQVFGARAGSSRIVATVPHHHIYGLLFRLLWPLATGRCFANDPCVEPSALAVELGACDATVLVSSPAQLSRLHQLLDFSRYRDRLRAIFSSGAPLAEGDALAYSASLGAAPVEVFGSTESGGIAWRCRDHDDAWTPMPRVDVSRGPLGNLVVSSPFALMPGEAPLELADCADIDGDGRFRLGARLDRVAKVGDKRVSLDEIESRLREHAWVRDARATLLPRARAPLAAAAVLDARGRSVLAARGSRAVGSVLRAHLAERFDLVVLPRFWRFPEVLPYDERGKLSTASLQALFARGAAT